MVAMVATLDLYLDRGASQAEACATLRAGELSSPLDLYGDTRKIDNLDEIRVLHRRHDEAVVRTFMVAKT